MLSNNLYKNFQNFWENKWDNVENISENDFAKKVINYFPDWEKLRLIDIWAWSWRDSLFFAKNKFELESFDFSKNALKNINNFSEKEKLFIKTTFWDLKNYYFLENLYDIVYSCNSLHYFSLEETKNIIKNIKKSLKDWWYIFLRVKSINDIDFWKWEKLEENFYKNWDDLKYYFSKEIISDLFSDFEIIELIEINDKHKKVSGEITISWFVDLVCKK